MIPLVTAEGAKERKTWSSRKGAVRFEEGLYLEEAETRMEQLEEISEQQTKNLAALQGDMPGYPA